MRTIPALAVALILVSATARAQPADPAAVATEAGSVIGASPTAADASPVAADAAPAETGEHNPLRMHVALAAMMAAQGADLATTMYALGTNRYDEANNAFDWLTHTPWAAGAVKMAAAAVFSYVMLHYHKQHPKLTFWMTVAAAGGYSAAAIHNSRTIR